MTDQPTTRRSPMRPDREGVIDHSASRSRRAVMLLRQHGVLGLFRLVRQHGLKASLRFVTRNIRHSISAAASRRYDRRLGVDTSGSIQLHALTIDSPNRDLGTEAVSTSPRSFDWMMATLPRPLTDFTFIDMGCGKGRTLLMAEGYGFRRIVGVEFAKELVDAARANIATLQARDPGRAAVLYLDAALFEFPDEPLVVYFYNPFGADVFATVIANLERRLAVSQQPCFIVYGSSKIETFDWFTPMIERMGQFKAISTRPMPLFLDAVRTIRFAVYRRTAARI